MDNDKNSELRFSKFFFGELGFGINDTCWIANVKTTLNWEKIRSFDIPITINHLEWDSSYVVSPYAALILYSKQELSKLPFVFRSLNLMIWPLSYYLKSIKINQVVSINNWLLSTNILPDFQPMDLLEVCFKLKKEYPRHFLFIRSLNYFSNSEIIKEFKRMGFAFIPSRQVYIFDFKKNNKTHNYILDKKFHENSLRNSQIKWLSAESWQDEQFAQAEVLYNRLYLEKYSVYNPAFTRKYLKLAYESKLMQLYALLDRKGLMVGVVGFFIQNNIMTVPIVGYDTHRPQREGLYRLLMAFSMNYAKEKGYLLNLSSGASSFKRLRGGVPFTEYSAVYLKELPIYRQICSIC